MPRVARAWEARRDGFGELPTRRRWGALLMSLLILALAFAAALAVLDLAALAVGADTRDGFAGH